MSTSIALPFSFTDGRVHQRTDTTGQLTDKVFSVLGTQVGERIMRPNYGANLAQFDFGLGDDLDAAAMKAEAQRALAQWESGAVLRDITFDAPPDQYGNLYATISYIPSGPGVGVVTQTLLVGVLANGAVTESGVPTTASSLGGGTTSPTVAATQTRYFGTAQ